MIWRDSDGATGVAVSYLIIIGQLMPKVVLGFNHDIAEASILLDRHFWITCFMFVHPAKAPGISASDLLTGLWSFRSLSSGALTR